MQLEMLVLSCTVTSTEITAFIFLCNPINSVHYMKNTLSAGQSTSTKRNISKRSIHNTFHDRITSKRNVHARSRGFQTLDLQLDLNILHRWKTGRFNESSLKAKCACCPVVNVYRIS